MRLTIGLRITLGFGLATFLLLLVAIATYRSVGRLVDAAQWREHTYEVLRDADAVASTLDAAESGARGFIVMGDEQYLESYRDAEAHSLELIRTLHTMTSDNASQQPRLDRLEEFTRKRFAEFGTAIATRRLQGFDAARELVAAGQGRRTMEETRSALSQVTGEERRLLSAREVETRASVDAAYATILIGSLLAVLVLVIGSFVITRSITKPIAELMIGAEKLGAGELGYRINMRGEDETAGLAVAFDRMAGRREAAENLVNAQSRERERVLAAVGETVQRLATASKELVAGAAQQAAGMQQQAAAVAETVTVVDEVNHTSSQAAERARGVAGSARKSEEVGRVGRKAVDDAVAVINVAKEQADKVAGKIASLAEQTQTVGEIVAVITDIAEQTNLLALNAAIEASRAGEHGRGFAVVATEVKALADESKKATQRVRRILGDIQKMASAAVMSTEDGTRSMNSATRAAAVAGETIGTLEVVVGEVAEAAAQIAASAGQQATGLAQIHQAMRDINPGEYAESRRDAPSAGRGERPRHARRKAANPRHERIVATWIASRSRGSCLPPSSTNSKGTSPISTATYSRSSARSPTRRVPSCCTRFFVPRTRSKARRARRA